MGAPGVGFEAGPWSHAGAWLLAAGTLAYAVATGFHAWRGFRHRLGDRWSCLGTAVALAALAALLATWGPAVVPAPFSLALAALMAGAVVFTLAFTALRLQRLVDQMRHAAAPAPGRPADELETEARRKVPHLLMGLFLLVYAGAGHLALQVLAAATPAAVPEAANVALARDAGWLAGGHVIGLWLLLAILYLLLPVELVRLRFPDAEYPWKRIIVSRLRRHEAGLMGAHIHITAALCATFLALTGQGDWARTVPAAMALLSVAVFADAASALAGRRWGRRKWRHNPDKSYLGSAGGALVALLVALPLVGLPMALASAAAFLVVDVVSPVPLPISDNLLNPAALLAIYLAGAGAVAPLLPWY